MALLTYCPCLIIFIFYKCAVQIYSPVLGERSLTCSIESKRPSKERLKFVKAMLADKAKENMLNVELPQRDDRLHRKTLTGE